MVCAKHINSHVGGVLGAGHFVFIVGDIASHIGVVAVRFNDHTVFVVAVVGGAHPPGAFSFKKLTVLFHLLNDAVGLTRLKYRVFVEEDIKVGAETVQGLFNLREHELGSDFTENLCGILGIKRIWTLGEDPVFNLGNIAARVTVFRGRLSLGGGQ